MSAAQRRVQESIETLQSAIGEDLTAAICEVHIVRRCFAACLGELSARTGRLETALAELEQATPLLLPFDEAEEPGRRVKAAWSRLFWAALAALCLAALVGGYLAGRIWGR